MFSVLRLGQRLIKRQTDNLFRSSFKFYSEEICKEEAEEVKKTWKMAEKQAPKLGKYTFQHLFKEHPEYVEFFPKYGKSAEELLCNEKFVSDFLVGSVVVSLGKAIKKIDDPCEADKIAKRVGKKHIKFCLKRKHFKNARRSFLIALKKVLGDKLTCDGEKAWTKASKVVFKGLAKGLR